MTKAEMKEFKKMFGKYCRDQINKGNCTEDTCEWCSIQAAYNEVKRFEKINSTITVRIYNIKWDIDEEDYSNEENEKLNLPNEVTHTFYEYNDINDEDLLDEIADWLSDEYGFCVNELEVEDCNLDGYEDDILYIEDVTGTLGEWFDMNTDEIPIEALKALQTAYSICVKALEGGN